MRASDVGLLLDQLFCRRACQRQKFFVAHEIGEAQRRIAALALAEVLSRAAQLEIELGDAETVGILVNHLEAIARRRRKRAAVEQNADALARAAADAPTQLVQLRETEALGALDHH